MYHNRSKTQNTFLGIVLFLAAMLWMFLPVQAQNNNSAAKPTPIEIVDPATPTPTPTPTIGDPPTVAWGVFLPVVVK